MPFSFFTIQLQWLKSYLARELIPLCPNPFFLGLDHYCRTAFTMLIKKILFKTKDALSQAAYTPSHVTLDFHEAHMELNDQGEQDMLYLGT